MSGTGTTNGSAGPFNGRHIQCALHRLGWTLAYEPPPDELAVFVERDTARELYFDLEREDIFYGDPIFKGVARQMLDPNVAGLTRVRAIRNFLVLLRSAVLQCLREETGAN